MSLTDYVQTSESRGGDGPHDDARRETDNYRDDRKILTRFARKEMSDEQLHQLLLRWSDLEKTPNIADELEEQELSEIGAKVFDEYQIDEQSRSGWLSRSQDAMDLAMQVIKARTREPWPGSSNVNFPIMAVAAGEFASRAYPAIIADRNVVKGVVTGNDEGVPATDPQNGQILADENGNPQFLVPPGANRERADRVASHMSWQKLEQQKEWEPDTDKLLYILPIIGSSFRKTWFDPTEGRNKSSLIYPKNFVVNYWAASIASAPRQTEILERYPYEVEEDIRAGIYCEHDYGPTSGVSADPDAPYVFLEQHRRLDLDQDGYSEPYIVTIDRETRRVARIVARYDAEGVLVNQEGLVQKIVPVEYYTDYQFFPNPEGGVYGVGFGNLLTPLNEQINATLNQLFDAGTLQNMQSGFLGKGLSMHSGTVKFLPGEWKVVNAIGSDIAKSVVPLQHPGPSTALFNLFGMLVESAREVASLKDVLTGERIAQNAPATTILALIEQGLKVFTAIFQRIHRSLKAEYEKDFRLNRIYLEDRSEYTVNNEPQIIERQDYMGGAGIEPVSNPKTVSDMQKLGRAEFLRQFLTDPFVEPVVIRKRIFEAAGIEKVDELLKTQQPPDPKLILETAKLELQVISVKADALLKMAQAYNAMAAGDVAAASIGFDFVNQQLEMLRIEMESLDKDKDGSGPEAAGGAGNNGNALRRLAPPPGNGGVPPVPAGLGAANGAGAPLGMAPGAA